MQPGYHHLQMGGLAQPPYVWRQLHRCQVQGNLMATAARMARGCPQCDVACVMLAVAPSH
jgi:hypothetical protein